MFVMLDATPPTILSAETLLLDDLAMIINAVYLQNLEPTQGGYIPKRIASKIRTKLKGIEYKSYEGVDLRLEMWVRLMQDMQLIKLSESPLLDIKDHYEPAPGMKFWARLDAIHQGQLLLEEWTKNHHWHDIAGIAYNPTGWFYLDPKEGRKILLEQLHACKTGQWYTIESILEEIWSTNHLAMRGDYKRLSKADQRKIKNEKEHWMELDGEVYTGMFASSLYELGIVELGYAEENIDPIDKETAVNPYAFQLSEFGAQVLHDLQTQSTDIDTVIQPTREIPRNSLIVQPNFELLLMQQDLPTLYSLLPFARLDQVGLASRLTLTQPALMRGLGSGKKIEQIIDTLETHSLKELPQNVVYTLQDWSRQHREARVSNVLLVNVSDEAIAQKLCDSPKFKSFGIRQLAPGLLSVQGDTNLSTLRNALDKEGIVVTIEGKFPRHAQNESTGRY